MDTTRDWQLWRRREQSHYLGRVCRSSQHIHSHGDAQLMASVQPSHRGEWQCCLLDRSSHLHLHRSGKLLLLALWMHLLRPGGLSSQRVSRTDPVGARRARSGDEGNKRPRIQSPARGKLCIFLFVQFVPKNSFFCLLFGFALAWYFHFGLVLTKSVLSGVPPSTAKRSQLIRSLSSTRACLPRTRLSCWVAITTKVTLSSSYLHWIYCKSLAVISMFRCFACLNASLCRHSVQSPALQRH